MRNKISMFFMLLMIASPTLFAAQAKTENPNPGPRTKAEPKILFDDGIAALANQEYDKAVQSFQRLVDRYPTNEHYTEANLKLGEAYLSLNQAARAIAPLRVYVKNHFADDLGNEARLKLAEAYLSVHKFSEARGITEEALKQGTSKVTKEYALLMKTLVLTRQKKFNDAKASLDAYTHSVEQSASAIKQNAAAIPSFFETKIKFLLKTAQCSAINEPATRKAKNEELWLDYLQALKTCFRESLSQNIEKLSKAELNEWCATLKSKEDHLVKSTHDRSFWPKIKEAFEEVKVYAKDKATELVHCYE